MATLAVQAITEAGVVPSYAAAGAGGDEFANESGDVLLHVKNGGGGPITVTVTAQATSRVLPGFGTVSKAAGGGSIGAGAEKMFGPFPPAAFNQANGRVAVGYTDVASVTVAAFRLKQP